jgi:Fungal protein kinase
VMLSVGAKQLQLHKGYHQACQTKVLHRDISINNINMVTSQYKGGLIDLDHVTILEAPSSTKQLHCSQRSSEG